MADVIVLGLGAMGSSAAQEMAERGHRVRGFDLYTPPHVFGSSHGESRIIRQAYWEDWRYVPLLLRAYEGWRRLEADSGQSLMQITGGLSIGTPEGKLVSGCEESSRRFGLPYEILNAAQIRKHHPAFDVEDGVVGHWEQNAGYLVPEACVGAQLAGAAKAGAELHYDEPVLEWTATSSGGVVVRTARGEYAGERLIVCAGPWAAGMLKSLQLPLTVTRQVVYWFEPRAHADHFSPGRMPIYLWEGTASQRVLYGFPLLGSPVDGVKVGLHGSDDICTPESVVREVTSGDEQQMRERLAVTLPSLAGRLVRAQTCLYTMTPDEHFVIDTHPLYPQVTIAAGFSGHGFKFATVMGEILADVATESAPPYDLGLFSVRRLLPFSSSDCR